MMNKVAILMGSKNDLPDLKGAFELLDSFKIPYCVRVISAHRTPAEAANFATSAAEKGLKVIICAAGMAAHLAGVIAAHTILPVIGVPMACEPFNGLDSLLSTVQMPPGIPVATVSAGKAGAKNSALFAAAILALSDKDVAERLEQFRRDQSEQVRQADNEVSKQFEK
ncbi:MAG: 5-(carboxyamino)imidazole ribonucleotide mutase [Victivallales bacterium]|nr:5-(carboxyamino)imidazole ribonucleotide mutase [Victivallales bacterium]